MLEDLRERLAAAGRELAADGLVLGAAGNLSAREGELIAVTPTGAQLAGLEAAQVAVLDLDGRQVDGPAAPTSELALHLGAYRRCGAGAVVHAHPPLTSALACVVDELPAIHYQFVELGGPIRVAGYATFGTQALATITLEALAGRTAVIMANHGSLTYGDDLEAAVRRTRLLEWLSGLYLRARSIGDPRELDAAALDAVRAELSRRRYGGLHEAIR